MSADPTANIAPWIQPRSLTPKILDILEAAERPLLLREIAQAANVRVQGLSSPLDRLCRLRFVRRFKARIVRPHGRYQGRFATHHLWLYVATHRA